MLANKPRAQQYHPFRTGHDPGPGENAQPLTTNLAEYLLVGATDMPHVDIIHQESPTPFNPLGVKGVGECGGVSTPAAVIAAIEDALTPFGAHISHAPVMPADIVALVAQGKAGAAP